jgi:RNA polymerase sigma-70 factor (ECF subfamily)
MSKLDPGTVTALRRRDPEAIGSVVREHARPLYRAARGAGFGEADAEDLTQDVLTTFLATLDRFEGRSQVRTWLFGILYRKMRERWRRRERDILHDSFEDTFESRFDANGSWIRPPADLQRVMESAEIGVALRRCIARLPAAQRVVFVLRQIEELDTKAVCKIVGKTVTNVNVVLHRARLRLRECLEARGVTSES